MALSGITELQIFKRRSAASPEEVEALLDLLPNPTLLADSRSGKVLFANALASQLTSYTRKEFLELNVPALLPELELDELEKAKSKPSYKLIKRNSSSLAVSVKTSRLGGEAHWTAITIQPTTQMDEQRGFDEQRWEAFHLLTLAAQQKELASCYRQILQAGALLTGADHLLLYTRDKTGSLHLETLMGSGIDFPTSLETKDLGHLRLPKVWQPGKPLDSALHKVANASKLAYLASAPLDLTEPENGLIVAANEKNPAGKEILTMLQILAASASTAALSAQIRESTDENLSELSHIRLLSAALQENVQDGLLFTDGQLKITAINPAGETLLGYTAREVLGRPVRDILVSEGLLPALEETINEGNLVELGEKKLHRRDGTEFLVLVRLVPLLAKGEVSKLAIFLSDLSEHEAFHVRSQQLQQRAWLGEVTAIFAHEVRNPINNISTGLQLMQMNLPETDPMQEQIKKLQEDCDRLEHRMKSVLSFSRSLDHNPQPMDMGEFCNQQLERWRPRMTRKNIQDHIQVAENTPLANGDVRALDQVFTNLITNAIQAMDGQENAFLAIKVAPNADDSNMVEVKISDNGPGIPEDLKKRVFEPFFTTKEEEGTGLGLAITRRIIMAHKGTIDLESFPGGTLFKINLPVAPNQSLNRNED